MGLAVHGRRQDPPVTRLVSHDRKVRVAVIGSGISGLGTAWLLRDRFDVTLFEARDRLGGHTHTVSVDDGRTSLGLDTGFLIFNRTTYPRLTRLFEALSIPTQATDMSFSVRCDACRLEYAGRGLRGLFAQKGNAFHPSFLRMLADIGRFAREGRKARNDRRTLTEYLDAEDFGDEFRRHYIVPMASALWSSGSETSGRFPIGPLFEFFRNHGLLRIRDRLDWQTIPGGSSTYVRAMEPALRNRVRTSCPIQKVSRDGRYVRVEWAGGGDSFDHVVIATHADQALALLGRPTDPERALLGAWAYTESDTWLHSDSRLLPGRRAAWSAWNYHVVDCRRPTVSPNVSYGLNFLQRLSSERDYFVTLNPHAQPEPSRVIARMRYRHPAMTAESTATWADLPELNGRSRISFCGSYFGTGFHEDGLRSAVSVSELLGGASL